MSRILGIAPLFLALSAPGLAHDFWIEPETFTPAPGDLVRVRLFVGHGASADELPRDPEHLERFIQSGPSGEIPVAGLPGARPAGAIRVQIAGTTAIGYVSRGKSLRLDAVRFERYLREEGLERIIDSRARRGETKEPGRETYYRSAKVLLVSGPELATGGHDRVLGLPLEIVPERDPYALEPGQRLAVRLLCRGKPVEGVLVGAHRRGEHDHAAARTDKDGRVELPIAARGLWIITAVHMTRAPEEDSSDWESWWASLTFDSSSPPRVASR